MYCCTKINNDIIWIGVNDRKTERFENYIPLDNGVTYNSYLILDEKICIIDGVEEGENGNFLGKIEAMIGTTPVDYIIVNHVEPDHSGSIKNMLKIYPEIKVVGNAKTIMMLKLLGVDLPDERIVVVKEKDVLDLGKHKLTFYLMPMVHWPESMATYDMTDKILFSNDAFGSFGTLDGGVFDDEVNTDFFTDEMRRYYSNIVGKFGAPVNAVLKKLSSVEISCICP
ncbi:FprA family A-type flavoprotein, partial [Fusobacterium sp. CM22]